MLRLNKGNIKNMEAWKQAGIELPKYDFESMCLKTAESPLWVHFGAGNIFRGFIAVLQQDLLDAGKASSGITAVETYDAEVIDKIYKPYDNLGLLVIMRPDGELKKKVVAGIGEALIGDPQHKADWERLKDIFTRDSLQMASFTITEKGYGITNIKGEYTPEVQQDMSKGPAEPKNVMAKAASLAYTRYKSGKKPIAFVSMDNCSSNGEKLHSSVETIVKAWVSNGLVEKDFLEYINDKSKVSFPWTMIDKITPRPSEDVKSALNKLGVEGMDPIKTEKNTFIAPFINAEEPQYLVVEDLFPNGRPQLELSGVYFADRETVDRVEKMKVGTCLNPLHTALAIFGSIMGYKTIADEMKDPELKKLVEKVGYVEGLPVVVNPGIIDPKDFIKEVIDDRLPNPYIPDTPQRIATDTSQKMGVRFGQTARLYEETPGLDPKTLTAGPLVIAGWCRYLMGLDDNGNEVALSPDPMMDVLKSYLAGIKFGDANSVGDKLKPILSNSQLFTVDLYKVGLGEKIEGFFKEMIAGKGAVKLTLKKYL